jgi:hypothetical protein
MDYLGRNTIADLVKALELKKEVSGDCHQAQGQARGFRKAGLKPGQL